MNVICLEEEAFFKLLEKTIERLSVNHTPSLKKWIDDEEAMALLNIKSKTSLQKLRDEGRIRYSQPFKKVILYDRESIEKFIEKNVKNTF